MNLIIHACDFRVLHAGYKTALESIAHAAGRAVEIEESSVDI